MRTNSISKFLFYNFNTLLVSSGRKPLLLRHLQIADNEYALERLQNKSWPYFIETLLEVSNNDVNYNNIEKTEERDIIDKTVNNLNDCKDKYNKAFIDISKCVVEALRSEKWSIPRERYSGYPKQHRGFTLV